MSGEGRKENHPWAEAQRSTLVNVNSSVGPKGGELGKRGSTLWPDVSRALPEIRTSLGGNKRPLEDLTVVF